MIHPNPRGDVPVVHRTAFVHPTAVLIGRVILGPRVFVGPRAVIRADEPGPDGEVRPIVVGAGANLQDGVIVHTLGDSDVRIGARSSLAHGALVHGPARVGVDCFVGFRSMLFKAELRSRVVVLHGCLLEDVIVPAGRLVPSGRQVSGMDAARHLPAAGPEWAKFSQTIARTNLGLGAGYRAVLAALEAGEKSFHLDASPPPSRHRREAILQG